MIYAAICALGLVGCATGPSKSNPAIVTEILSDPPGARIEVNGNYIGETPARVTLDQAIGDHVVVGRQTITATPKEAGQYAQMKVFQGPEYPFDPRKDVAPKTVFFNMKLPPATSDQKYYPR